MIFITMIVSMLLLYRTVKELEDRMGTNYEYNVQVPLVEEFQAFSMAVDRGK